MKRILALILALLMLTPTAFADTTPQMTYRLKGDKGKVGDVVKVVLSVEDAPKCVAYETTLTYDPEVLEPTGDYQKMYLKGLMVVNTEYEENGKKMVKIAAVAISDPLLEGTMDLLNISFKIIGMPEDPDGSVVDVYDYTFSQDDDALTPVSTLLLVPTHVRVTEGGTLTQPEETPAPEETEKEDKEQGGDWYFDGNQAIEYYPDSSDDSAQYEVEYEKDEEGNTTGVILYDPEDKTEVGRLEVEADEYGNLNVLDKNMEATGKKKGGSFSLWFLLPIGAAVLVAAGGVILAIKMKKKK